MASGNTGSAALGSTAGLHTAPFLDEIQKEHRLRPSLTRDTASHLPSAEDIRAEKAEIGGSDIPTSAIDPKLKSGRAGAIAGSSK